MCCSRSQRDAQRAGRLLCAQVPEGAPLDAINAAGRRLSLQVHPDRCKLPQARDAFERVRAALTELQTA